MPPTIPETHKKPGVCYATTNDGIELPVIDLTHPAFAFSITQPELDVLIEAMQRSANIPAAVLQGVAQKSILVRGFVESAGTFTTGMMTYLNKLGPDNLGDGYAGPIDRQWAASLTPLTFRWRMRDVALSLVEGLKPSLAARPGAPLHLLNIAGGPAMDSLNALILLYKQAPELMCGRLICLHVLDLDQDGPSFGSRALQALLAEGAPLHGLSISFEYIPYNWSELSPLSRLLQQLGPEVVAAGSSEGGLFEYASDEDIVANLKALHAGTPDDFVMAGPVVRDEATLDPRLRMTVHILGQPAIRYIGLSAFETLAARSGWTIASHLDGPMHQVVTLKKYIN
jgi:hypothetical protein